MGGPLGDRWGEPCGDLEGALGKPRGSPGRALGDPFGGPSGDPRGTRWRILGWSCGGILRGKRSPMQTLSRRGFENAALRYAHNIQSCIFLQLWGLGIKRPFAVRRRRVAKKRNPVATLQHAAIKLCTYAMGELPVAVCVYVCVCHHGFN